jgi:hypothetical protein
MHVELRYRTDWVMANIHAKAVDAESFGVTDRMGLALSEWALNPADGRVVIAFKCESGKKCAEFGTTKRGYDPRSLGSRGPFMAMQDPDDVASVQIEIGSHDPLLTMWDHMSRSRLLLGHIPLGEPTTVGKDPDNWALAFDRYARIGVTTPPGTNVRTGYVDLRNSSGRQLWSRPK